MTYPKVLSSVAAIALAAGATAPAVVRAAPPADALVAVEAKIAKAMVAKDLPTLDAVFAPDWRGQNPSGRQYDKTMLMADLKTGKNTISAMTNHDVHARVLGDVAIVQGMDDETSAYDGNDTSGTYSWTDVYQRRAGKWVAIASQVTPIMK